MTKMLKLGAVIAGKQEIATRLFGNLQVDISKTVEVLGWKPPITVDQGLEKAVKGFYS
jgi:nucleoside-diphosphate-sugar epimerase